ncbi:MAG: hypothetical protein ACLFVO_14600 [Chloroflexaceae bacterium]
MATRVEVEVDDQGRLVLPVLLARRLGLTHGATLVVEEETAAATYLRIQQTSPVLIEEGGVLVITAVADQSLKDALQADREQRLGELWERNHAHLT